MKKRIPAAAVLVMFMSLIFSSCSINYLIPTVDSLMTPPLYYSRYKDLVNLFTASTGDNIVLCSPNEGEHTSAIIIEDLDGDGSEDGLILYRNTLDDGLVRFMVFKGNADGNKWTKCGEPCDGLGNDANSLVLTDFDGDGVKEIVIAWNYSGVIGDNAYSVYKATAVNFVYSEFRNDSCTVARVVDLDADGVDEIFCISGNMEKGENSKSARLLKFSDESGDFETVSEIPVDPLVGYYSSFKTEEAADGEPARIYLDGAKGNNQMITEVIFWDAESGTLKDPLYDNETGTNNLTLRYEHIQCRDIDSDGKIEIPVQEIYFEPEDKDAQTVYLTRWTRFGTGTPEVREEAIVNISDGYYIPVRGLRVNDLRITKNTGGESGKTWSSWSFYSGNTEHENALFTVVVLDRETWDRRTSMDDSYVLIAEHRNGVVCARLNENGEGRGLNLKDTVIDLPG